MLEVVGGQRRGDRAVALAVGAVRALLAVPLNEVDLVLAPLHDLDQAVGQLLLAVRRDPLGAAVVLEHDGAEALDLVLVRQRRTALDVDVLDRHLVGDVAVLVEARAEAIEVVGTIEHPHDDRTLEALQHLLRLVRERELLRRGQVPPLVVPRRDVVDAHENRQHDGDAGERQRAESRLSPGEGADHVAPLTEDVEQCADEAGDGERCDPALEPLDPGHEAQRERREHQHDAEPAEKTENSFQHTPTRASARCPPTSPSGTARK